MRAPQRAHHGMLAIIVGLGLGSMLGCADLVGIVPTSVAESDGSVSWDGSLDIDAAIHCGNGIFEEALGEECDTSGVNTDACDLDCTRATCGDEFFNAEAGEVCDTGGDTAACDADCTAVTCGDNYANTAAGETCDTGGETEACDADCTESMCGDGWVNIAVGEDCDHGDPQNPGPQDSIDCDSNCTAVSCGDGYTNTAAGEQCDDGNLSNADDCVDGCFQATCGDGFWHTQGTGPFEVCEDTSQSGRDAGCTVNVPNCSSDCMTCS